MDYLDTQEQLEVLLGKVPDIPAPKGITVIYFTATWCGPCKRMDMDFVRAATPYASWLKCDVDRNTYSPGYCGAKAIPYFMIIQDGKVLGTLQSSDSMKVAGWIKTTTGN
jgi:thioredoxin 1